MQKQPGELERHGNPLKPSAPLKPPAPSPIATSSVQFTTTRDRAVLIVSTDSFGSDVFCSPPRANQLKLPKPTEEAFSPTSLAILWACLSSSVAVVPSVLDRGCARARWNGSPGSGSKPGEPTHRRHFQEARRWAFCSGVAGLHPYLYRLFK